MKDAQYIIEENKGLIGTETIYSKNNSYLKSTNEQYTLEYNHIIKNIYAKNYSTTYRAPHTDNPLRLVFKMAKTLLETKPTDEEIYKAKIQLAEELVEYDKVKNEEQIKALADFLEYLFLIKDKELEKKFEEYKRERGGAVKMTVDQIRQKYYEQKGKEEGEYKKAIEIAKNLIKLGLSTKEIMVATGLEEEQINEIRNLN